MKVTFELFTDEPADSAALAKLLSVLTSPDTYTHPPAERVVVTKDVRVVERPQLATAETKATDPAMPNAAVVAEVKAADPAPPAETPKVSLDDLKAVFTDFIKNKAIGGPANAKKLLQGFGAECLVGTGALDASKYAEVHAAIKAALEAAP